MTAITRDHGDPYPPTPSPGVTRIPKDLAPDPNAASPITATSSTKAADGVWFGFSVSRFQNYPITKLPDYQIFPYYPITNYPITRSAYLPLPPALIPMIPMPIGLQRGVSQSGPNV